MREAIPSDGSEVEKTAWKSNRIAEGLYHLTAISVALLAGDNQALTREDLGNLRALLIAIEDALKEIPDHRLATGSDVVQSFTEVAQRLANIRAAVDDDVLTPAALASMRELLDELGVKIPGHR
jgi:hypothetical protein